MIQQNKKKQLKKILTGFGFKNSESYVELLTNRNTRKILLLKSKDLLISAECYFGWPAIYRVLNFYHYEVQMILDEELGAFTNKELQNIIDILAALISYILVLYQNCFFFSDRLMVVKKRQGDKLREIRLRHNLTLLQLGKKLNMSLTTISKLENSSYIALHKPSINKIIDYFDIDASDLIL